MTHGEICSKRNKTNASTFCMHNNHDQRLRNQQPETRQRENNEPADRNRQQSTPHKQWSQLLLPMEIMLQCTSPEEKQNPGHKEPKKCISFGRLFQWNLPTRPKIFTATYSIHLPLQKEDKERSSPSVKFRCISKVSYFSINSSTFPAISCETRYLKPRFPVLQKRYLYPISISSSEIIII